VGLFNWVKGRVVKLTDGEFWARHYGNDNWTNEVVTADAAMKLSAWWACVRLIAETVASLPIGVFISLPRGGKEMVDTHWLYDIIHNSPNADQTAVEFWEGMVMGLCLEGNAYAEKQYTRGKVSGLVQLPIMEVTVSRTKTGELQYKYVKDGKEIILS
jgi:HK97 family phage portal protein